MIKKPARAAPMALPACSEVLVFYGHHIGLDKVGVYEFSCPLTSKNNPMSPEANVTMHPLDFILGRELLPTLFDASWTTAMAAGRYG